LNVGQLLRIFVARWWVIVLVFGACMGGTAIVTALLPREYTASSQLVIEQRFTDVLGGANLSGQMAAQTYLATQMDILRSQRVAERVVRTLNIPTSATAQARWLEATEGRGTIEAYYAEALVRRLEVRPSRESLVLTISFSANDPLFAKQVADAFAQAYIDTNLELRITPAKQYADWFAQQSKELRADLETAQTRLSAFQQRNSIVGNDERLDIENARLGELSSQLALAQSQAVDARSLADVAAPTVRSVPDVAATPLLQNLRADLVRTEAKLEEASQTLGAAHPSLLRLTAERDALRERVEGELLNASGTVTSVSRASTERETQLRREVAVQKARVLDIKRQRDEMAVLIREVESAQRVYDLALQRFATNSLESQATQTSAYLLNPAAQPATPSSPRTTLNLILSSIMGALLGLGTAVLMEVADRRVRSSSDIVSALQLPVLGTLVRPPRRLGLPWRSAPALPAGRVV
jgi:chain length determinant protein EpsF